MLGIHGSLLVAVVPGKTPDNNPLPEVEGRAGRGLGDAAAEEGAVPFFDFGDRLSGSPTSPGRANFSTLTPFVPAAVSEVKDELNCLSDDEAAI